MIEVKKRRKLKLERLLLSTASWKERLPLCGHEKVQGSKRKIISVWKTKERFVWSMQNRGVSQSKGSLVEHTRAQRPRAKCTVK